MQTEKIEAPSKTKMILRRMVPGLMLGLIVLIGLSLLGDVRSVSQMMLHFHWSYFGLAILFTLFNYTLRFFKWHFYLGQIGVKNISLVNSARLFVAGFPLAVTPGKVGEALKGVWLKQLTDIPIARGVAVVVAERISDGLAVLALSVLGVIAYPHYWPVFAIILVILLACVIISQIRPAALAMLAWGEQIPVVKKTIPALREFYEGSFSLFRPGATLLAVGLGTISWLGEGIGFYLILVGLGMPANIQLAAFAIFVLAFSTIIGAASALPGGLGAAEASIAGMLTLLGGVEPAVATSATLLIRFATLWFGVGLGLLTWVGSRDLLGLQNIHNDETPR